MQWKTYVHELIASGMTQKQIAAEAACGQATVSDLATGKAHEPRGTLALALLRIGAQRGVPTPADIWPELAEPTKAGEVTHG